MPFKVLRELNNQVEQINAILNLNDELRQQIAIGLVQTATQIDAQYWRRYDYCAAVLRLYASFERFIIDSTQRWLDWIVANNYSLLSKSPSAVDRYRYGSAEILRRASEARFSKINLSSLVDALAALQNEKVFALGTDALFATTPNIRFGDVTSVLEAVEVSEPRAWIAAYQPLVEQCEILQSTAEAFLKELVERRNEAAHGNRLPDDVWSIPVIKSASEFVLRFSAAVAELLAARMAITGTSENVVYLGQVKEIFVRRQAFVVHSMPAGIWVGMKIVVVSKARCYVDVLQSIHLNGISANAWLSHEAEEVGYKLGKLPPATAQLYSIPQIE